MGSRWWRSRSWNSPSPTNTSACGMILTTTKKSTKHLRLNKRARKTLGNWVEWKKKKRKELGVDLHPCEGAVKKERFPHPESWGSAFRGQNLGDSLRATVWYATTKGVQQEAWISQVVHGVTKNCTWLSDWTTTDGYLGCFKFLAIMNKASTAKKKKRLGNPERTSELADTTFLLFSEAVGSEVEQSKAGPKPGQQFLVS